MIFDVSVKSSGRASSLQAKNTANKVPAVICSLKYISAATTDTPHWGIIPEAEPISGDNLFCFPMTLEIFPSKKDNTILNKKAIPTKYWIALNYI